MSQVLPSEPELGLQRYCRRCEEWYPLDAEFWFRLGTTKITCRACQREWSRGWCERNPERRRASQRVANLTPLQYARRQAAWNRANRARP